MDAGVFFAFDASKRSNFGDGRWSRKVSKLQNGKGLGFLEDLVKLVGGVEEMKEDVHVSHMQFRSQKQKEGSAPTLVFSLFSWAESR